MSETPSDRKSDSGEKIIDAEVEPLAKARPRRLLKLAVFFGLALIGSIAVAALYHLWSTDRLDQIFAGRSAPQPSSPTAVTLPVSPPAPTPAPAAPAPVADTARVEQQAGRIDALEQRLAALTAGLERLQQLPSDSDLDRQKLGELETRLKASEAARADLEQKIALLIQTAEAQTAQRSSLQQQVGAQQQQLADLQGRLATANDRNAAALHEPLTQLLAWSELRDRARSGRRFADQAAAILPYAERQGGALGQAAAGWRDFAEKTPPAMARLSGRFMPLLEQQLSAKPESGSEPDPATQSWWQRAIDKVAGLVSIRKLGGAEENRPESRLAAAEAAMQAGDAPAVLAALDGLALTPELAEWRDQLKARLALDAALDAYGAALRAHLAALQ